MKIIFDELAADEYYDAIEYYELEISGLGSAFKGEMRRVLRTLQQYPKIGFVEQGDVQRYILHKFPFKILYSVEKDYLYIIAIAHMHRQPGYWVHRIKSH